MIKSGDIVYSRFNRLSQISKDELTGRWVRAWTNDYVAGSTSLAERRLLIVGEVFKDDTPLHLALSSTTPRNLIKVFHFASGKTLFVNLAAITKNVKEVIN